MNAAEVTNDHIKGHGWFNHIRGHGSEPNWFIANGGQEKKINGGNDKLNGENQTSQLKLYKITSNAMQGSNKSNNKSKRNQISPAQTVDQKNISVGGNEKLQRKQ